MKLSIRNISSVINVVSSIEDTLTSGACYDVVGKLVKVGTGLASNYDAVAPRSGETPNIILPIEPKISKSNVVGGVAMTGENAVYDEFGTGEQGKDNPHPMKGNFNLNPYNSGPTIFYNQFAGRHQWYYKPMASKPYFTANGVTEGIPAGKQMYNTSQDLRKNAKSIAAPEINKTVRELNKVINKFK